MSDRYSIHHPNAADLLAAAFIGRLLQEMGVEQFREAARLNGAPDRDPEVDCYSRTLTDDDSAVWYADVFEELFGWPEADQSDEERNARGDLYSRGWDRAHELGLAMPRLASLAALYEVWRAQNVVTDHQGRTIPPDEGDALELLMGADLTFDQREWLGEFVGLWDAVQETEDLRASGDIF